MESNPLEAVRNNAIATRVTAETAAVAGCERFVLVSTDKAVNPRTVMGASKAMAEWIVEAARHKHPQTRFITVRFGNVLASSGSVVPIFRSQIERGGPVTVTDAEMTRYFMTIPEAVQLVIRAGDLGAGHRRGLRARDGRAGEDRRPRPQHDPAGRLRARDRHRDRVHRPPARARSSTRSSSTPTSARRRPSADKIVRAVRRAPLDPEWVTGRVTRLEQLVREGDEAHLAEQTVDLVTRAPRGRPRSALERLTSRAVGSNIPRRTHGADQGSRRLRGPGRLPRAGRARPALLRAGARRAPPARERRVPGRGRPMRDAPRTREDDARSAAAATARRRPKAAGARRSRLGPHRRRGLPPRRAGAPGRRAPPALRGAAAAAAADGERGEGRSPSTAVIIVGALILLAGVGFGATQLLGGDDEHQRRRRRHKGGDLACPPARPRSRCSTAPPSRASPAEFAQRPEGQPSYDVGPITNTESAFDASIVMFDAGRPGLRARGRPASSGSRRPSR